MITTLDYQHGTEQGHFLDKPVSCGTTIMAASFDGGVICVADSRTSSGPYVHNRFTDKVTPITDRIACLRSGAAADTQTIRDVAAYYLLVYEMETDEPALVHTAANSIRNICYNYRDQLSAGIIVAGWDQREGGQVYSIQAGGMLTRQPIVIGGSGSTYVYGYVDATYKENMSKEECLKFLTNAIALAISRDGASGGSVNIAIITKDGTERRLVLSNDLPTIVKA